ncbi:MAG: hypothetical protein R2939_03460 [Kofleriaceae bacterium]
MDAERGAVDELSYLAIHQPGVVRLLEDELGRGDGDALAAGLELACRLLIDRAVDDGVPLPRLSSTELARGLAAAPARPRATPALAALPVLLTRAEEAAVERALAAVRIAAAGARG